MFSNRSALTAWFDDGSHGDDALRGKEMLRFSLFLKVPLYTEM